MTSSMEERVAMYQATLLSKLLYLDTLPFDWNPNRIPDAG